MATATEARTDASGTVRSSHSGTWSGCTSNSLQVMSSNRYVYSSTDEFDLVRQMLADQPGWRTGPQIQIG